MFSPGFGWGPPSPGCDCTGLVASGSSELEAALPVHSVRSLRRSLALVRADDSLPLVSSLSAEHFGLWPYGLAIAWISDLISNEGIATVGLLRAVRPCLGVSLCHPLVGRSAL